MMPAFYDFFRKFTFRPNVTPTLVPGAIVEDTTIEADSVKDTATIIAGQNISFGVTDTLTGLPGDPNTSTDTVTINGPDYQTYVPLGTTKLRLELNGGDATSDIELQPDPLSPISITRTASNIIKIGSNNPSLPFSQEQIEDLSAALLTNGTHTELTVTYQDFVTLPSTFAQDATDGSGINAVFNLSIINNLYVASVVTAGSGYVVGNTVTIYGTNFPGGLNPANNATITVGTVDGTGGILTIASVTGTPIASDNIDLAVTSTLENITTRGASSTNAITISNATGSSNTSTGALKLTAGGLAVFENANVGGYVQATTLRSTVATGTAPLTVASTTAVANLQAATASKWHTARTVTFTGDVTGSFSIDGSADVSNVELTVGADKVALGTDTTGSYVAIGAVSGNGLSGSANSETATFTVSSNATSVNIEETIVFRDASGNFSAGSITASLNGNAATVTNGFYTTSSFNLGTTSIAVNRASAAQSLSGIISIDGYAQGLAGGNATTLLGSLPYQSNTNTTSLLSPNTTTSKRFLTQTGTGTNGAVPSWGSILNADVPNLTGKTYNELSLTANATGWKISGGTTEVAVSFAGGAAYTLSGTNSTTITLPTTTGTVALNNQQFFIGTTSVAINRTSGALSLSGVSIDGSAGSAGSATTSTNLAGGNSTTLLGALPYQSNTNTTSLLSPNTTTSKQFLRMTGTGANGAAPAWDSVTATDVGLGNVTNESKATMFSSPTFTGNAIIGTNTGSTLRINNATGTPANSTTVTGWMALNINGTTRYVPYYT